MNSDLQCNVDGYVFGDEKLETRPRPTTPRSPSATKEPDPILPLRISFVEIVPRSTSTTEKVREPIGTGPYAIEDWEYGQKLLLKRNDTYWGKKPAFARAEYQWRSEGSVRAAMITNDEADIATVARTRRRRRRSRRPVPEQRDHRAAHAGHRGAAQRHSGAPGDQLRRQPRPASSRRCSAGWVSLPLN